jgi:septum formation protein
MDPTPTSPRSARSRCGSPIWRKLILASASPRRREILSSLGIPFEVVAPDVEEVTEGNPEALVLENARLKASAGLATAQGGSVVLGVDTEVVLDGAALGKAADEIEARAHLESLSGRTHVVLSGMVLLGPAGEGAEGRSGVSRSEVTFRSLDAGTLAAYLGSGEWRDRAGAYAVQGLGSILVDRVQGDLSNVIGLPIRLLFELAPELLESRRFGFPKPSEDSPLG